MLSCQITGYEQKLILAKSGIIDLKPKADICLSCGAIFMSVKTTIIGAFWRSAKKNIVISSDQPEGSRFCQFCLGTQFHEGQLLADIPVSIARVCNSCGRIYPFLEEEDLEAIRARQLQQKKAEIRCYICSSYRLLYSYWSRWGLYVSKKKFRHGEMVPVGAIICLSCNTITPSIDDQDIFRIRTWAG